MRAGMRTSPTRPLASTTSNPEAATAEPTTPPINACDELEGRPNHQVTRFQKIAPISPAKTTVGVIAPASTMPFATTAATESERNAPAKLRMAANVTATFGGTARVEIAVATTFAVSWNPLVKSNATAVAMTMTRMMSLSTARLDPAGSLPVLDDDVLEDVGRAFRRVDRLLQAVVDVLPPDHDHRVDAGLEERGEALPHDPVALVLEAMDLGRLVGDVVERPHLRHGQPDLARGLEQDVREALRLLHRRLDLVEHEEVRDLLGEVDDVVQRRGQGDDVLTVDRRDERVVQPLDDVVREPVALLLADQDVARDVLRVREASEHLVEEVGAAHEVARRRLEQVEELALAGREEVRQAGHGRPIIRTAVAASARRAPRGRSSTRAPAPGTRPGAPRRRRWRPRRPSRT